MECEVDLSPDVLPCGCHGGRLQSKFAGIDSVVSLNKGRFITRLQVAVERRNKVLQILGCTMIKPLYLESIADRKGWVITQQHLIGAQIKKVKQ